MFFFNVKKYIEKKGLSQIQLALEIGMSGGAYLGRAEIRKNNHHFNIKHLAKIAKVLGPFEILCQLGKIKNTRGHEYENRDRCRAIC